MLSTQSRQRPLGKLTTVVVFHGSSMLRRAPCLKSYHPLRKNMQPDVDGPLAYCKMIYYLSVIQDARCDTRSVVLIDLCRSDHWICTTLTDKLTWNAPFWVTEKQSTRLSRFPFFSYLPEFMEQLTCRLVKRIRYFRVPLLSLQGLSHALPLSV